MNDEHMAENNTCIDQRIDKENTQETVEYQPPLEECLAELASYKEQYLRLSADFQNYKGRIAKEQQHMQQMTKVNIFSGILSLVDNIDRAVDQYKNQDVPVELKTWFDGFELIHKDLHKFLHTAHIKEVVIDGQFDPIFHEAVAQLESPEHETGSVVEQIQKGYMLGDYVLRPAKVVVAV